MNKHLLKRKCSAVCHDGHPCRAWAVIDSDPALCAVHAGLNAGAGAPKGNQNALRHGLYAAAMKPEEIADRAILERKSLMDELVLMRSLLRRLGVYLEKEELAMEEALRVVTAITTAVRAVAHLQRQIADEPFDWDLVLDELDSRWGMDI